MEQDDPYVCVGVCMSDPDSGYCLGCGRPPMGEAPAPSATSSSPTTQPASSPAADTNAAVPDA